MSYQNPRNCSMSAQQGYMTSPPPTVPHSTAPSNGSQFAAECPNQFRGHPYQPYPNQECPPEMPAPNVSVSQPGHGQALTLNQLLLQNNSPGSQPSRVPGAMSPMSHTGGYRYDPYGYMSKPGVPVHHQESNQPPPMKEPNTQEGLLRSSRANTPQENASEMRSPLQPPPEHQQQIDSVPKSQPNRPPGGPSPLPGYGSGMPQDTRMGPGTLRPGVMSPGVYPPRSGYPPPEYGQDPYGPYSLQRYPPPPPQSSRYPTPGGYTMMPPPPPPASGGYPPTADYQKMPPYMMPDHSNYPRPYQPDMYTRSGYSQPPMSNGVSPPPRGMAMRYPPPPTGGLEGVVSPNSQQEQQPPSFPPQQQQPQPPNRAEPRDEGMPSRMSGPSEQPPTSSSCDAPSRPSSSTSSPYPPSMVRSGPPPSPKKDLPADEQQQQQQPPPLQHAMPHHQYMVQQQQHVHPMYRQGPPVTPHRMPPRGPPPGSAYAYSGYPPNFPQQQYLPQHHLQQPYPGGDMPPTAMYHQIHPQSSYGHPQQAGPPPPPHQYPYHRGYPPQPTPMHAIAPPPNLSPQSASCFSRLMEMGYEPERRQWLEHYFFFMEEINKPLTGLPQVVKQPLDLYRFYLAVRERGGVLEVIKTKRWKEISQIFNINASASAAYTLRKNYCKYLLDYECRFDHGPGGADVRVVAAQIETLSGKKKKPSVGSMGGAGSEMNESSTSSSTPFPPPSPAGSQSSASSNLLPQPSSNGAPGVSEEGAKTGGPGSPVGVASPASSSAGASPYHTPAPSASTSTPTTVEHQQQQHQQQVPASYPMSGPWRPSPSPNQRPPFPPPGYPPQHRMPGPGYGEMVGRHPYPPPQSYGRPAAPHSSASGGSHPMAAMEGMRPGSPEGAVIPPSKAPTGNTVHHPPQQQPPPPPPMMYQRGPPYMNQHLPHHALPPPSFTAHYQPSQPGGRPGGGPSPQHPGRPMPPFGAPGYSPQVSSNQPPPPPLNTSLPSHRHPSMVPQQPSPHPGMVQQQRPGPAYVTAAAAAAYWKRLEAAQLFPPGCVEATPIDTSRRRRYRIKDLGPLTASKLVMALRCGLPSETTWALNALNIVLRDDPNALESYFSPPTQQSAVVGSSTSPTLTNLVTALTDHLRHSANELFPQHRLAADLELPIHLDQEGQPLSRGTMSIDPSLPDLQTPSKATNHDNFFVELLAEVSSRRRCIRMRSQPPPANGLLSLEREIASIANSKGVSVSALQEAIRQLLQGSGKNGRLLLKSVTPKLPKTPSVESNLEKSGGPLAKRGRGRGSATPILAEHLAMFEAGQTFSLPMVPKHFSLIVNNLSGPEASSNMRRLALFALDELLEGKESPPPVLLPADLAAEPTSPPGSPRPPSMRELFVRGGSDSTCYILPHPGSAGGASSGKKRSLSPGGVSSETQAKRTRSSSSSSLPVLSPQKFEPVPTVVGDKEASSALEEEDSELNSHRLMTDSRGYCPLRARSEIIRRGDLALWPVDITSRRAEDFALRCLCVSTVLRNLSFLPTGERVLSNHKALLALAGRLLTIAHTHFEGSDADWACVEDHAARFYSHSAWWMPWLDELCENILVLLVNISGHLQCLPLHESIVRPLLEGLLHWATCQTAAATDPLPGHRVISPGRLALEALNRLSVNDSNVSMLLATMDNECASRLFDRLASWLALPEDQVTRELALSTLHYLSEPPVNISQQQFDGNNAFTYGLSMIAQAKPCPIAGLISFIEVTEAKTRRVIEQYGVQALQEQPELMGTSLELLRRAGALLERLAANPFGISRFSPELELRVLGLATSRVLDATVAQLLSGCLLNLPQRDRHSAAVCDLLPPIPSPEHVAQLLSPSMKTKRKKEQRKESDPKEAIKEASQPQPPSPPPKPELIAAV
uniref:ARID domain-containing protein n=1 Tax=Mesocestoides corti TaxID=53468 RepID=A0A5K3EGI9_MESCO